MKIKQYFETGKDIFTTLNVATVGYRDSYRELLMHLFSTTVPDGLVRIKILAIACAPYNELPGLMSLDGVAFYDSVEELCENIADVNIVFDLSEEGEYIEKVKQCAPKNVSVVGGDAMLLFRKTVIDPEPLEIKACDLDRALGLFSTFVDKAEEEFWLLDKEGVVLDANSVVLNRERDEEFEGTHEKLVNNVLLYALQPGNAVTESINTARRTDQVVTNVTSDGELQYFGLSAYPVVKRDGTVRSVILTRRDITENYFMVRNLQQTEKLAAVGEMSAFVAHEIRNPLFAIGGFANALLKQNHLEGGDRKKIEIIFNESKRLEKILKIILNFARPAHGSDGEVDVNEVIMEALGLLRLKFEAQGGIVISNLSEKVAKVRGNPDQVKQCVINGIKNGFEAMPHGGTLKVETTLSADNWVIVRIIDSGEGIPDDVREHIFNPFFSTKSGGTGLGLAMTKKIIEDMGGKVKLRSKPYKGTMLAFYLPPISLNPPKPPKQETKGSEDDTGNVGFFGGPAEYIP
ncbi:PAS domain-containing sensor histidine kinase [Halodesulfovibrio sp.]|uniref:two-component system sensor histidine kinase NtrB n=1 Tax=Halodesulfovibrio sp. TaxID=1912772 RepID=UPI0025D69575|nr:PAS domain-containing sensor histidine kinase [Halodesulfovibrio sp.]MCT4626589.1 ATP-binding protein [Halodesulfovibrio sp.]